MARARGRASRAASYFPVKIPIFSLSGGVGRQIPSKRLPSEVEFLTNFSCTTESSLDKRNGFRRIFLGTWDRQYAINPFDVDNLFYYWMDVDALTSYLFILNTNYTNILEPTENVPADFMRVYKITQHIGDEWDGNTTVENITIDAIPTDDPNGVVSYVSPDSWKYLTYRDPDSTLPVRERLEAVSIGSSVMVVNKEVEAGFTTRNASIKRWTPGRWTTNETLKKLDGSQSGDPDDPMSTDNPNLDWEGSEITYLTSSAVDPLHKAESWNEHTDYTWASTVIDLEDPIYKKDADDDGTGVDEYPYEQFRGFTWDDTATESYPGSSLIIDFTSEVTRLDTGEDTYFSDSRLGNQITLKGIQNISDEAQEINYLWINRNGSTRIQFTGELFHFTEDGTIDGTEGAGPNRATTVVVNPADHSEASTATATLKMPKNHKFYRYPDIAYTPDVDGDGGLPDGADWNAAPEGEEGANSSGWRAKDGNLTDRSKTGWNAFQHPSMFPIDEDGTIIGDREVYEYNYEDDAGSGDGFIHYIQLEDSTGKKTRFYPGHTDQNPPCASLPWTPTEIGSGQDIAITEATIRAVKGYGGRIYDAWCSVSNPDSQSPAATLAGAINDSDLEITATFTNDREIILTMDSSGVAGNTEIKINGFGGPWTVEKDQDDDYRIRVNGAYEPPSGVDNHAFTGGSGSAEASYSKTELGSGYADAAEFAKAINEKQSNSLTAFANQFSVTNTQPFPGRIIIIQAGESRTTNTPVWYNVWTDNGEEDVDDDIIYDLSSHTSTGLIPPTFTGGVQGKSIQDLIQPTWAQNTLNYWESADDWTSKEQFLTYDNEGLVPLRHGIWRVRDYLPADELPGPVNMLLSSDDSPKGSQLPPHEDCERWERVPDENSDLHTEMEGDENRLNVLVSRFIPAEDFIYPNKEFLNLGQSVSKLSDLTFPPDITDLQAFNGNAVTTKTLETLYDIYDPNQNEEILPELTHWQAQTDNTAYRGKGKIVYLSEAYLENTPGWYRYTDKDTKPYLTKVRTPSRRAVIDKKRMPQMLYPLKRNDGRSAFGIRPIDWGHRTSGDSENNRGPGIFFSPTTDEPQESRIKAMAFYRDRLFLANDDTIIASRSGDWDNFFLEDPDNITDSDPLDLMVSSNNYTPITHLIPFRDFLFVGTSGNTQFELIGANNIISPKTAEFAPTSFYPMLPDVPPVPLNNNLFFFASQKLYIYFGQRDLATEQAFEVSKHVENYLPKRIECVTASSHSSMIFALDHSRAVLGMSDIYCYRNQIAGEKVVQNAFFLWDIEGPRSELAGGQASLKFIKASGKYLFGVNVWYDPPSGSPEDQMELDLFYMPLDKDNIGIPRLDNLAYQFTGAGWAGHITEEGVHKTKIDLFNFYVDRVVHGNHPNPTREPYYTRAVTGHGAIYVLTKVEHPPDDPDAIYTIEGLLTPAEVQSIKYVGTPYTSQVTLSETFLRDEANNIIPGTLNLRYGVIQVFDSPNFEVHVTKPNRSLGFKKHVYNQEKVGGNWPMTGGFGLDNTIGRPYVKETPAENFQVRFPIMDFSKDVVIRIQSSTPHPLNIASIQLTGKFKAITKFHSS